MSREDIDTSLDSLFDKNKNAEAFSHKKSGKNKNIKDGQKAGRPKTNGEKKLGKYRINPSNFQEVDEDYEYGM